LQKTKGGKQNMKIISIIVSSLVATSTVVNAFTTTTTTSIGCTTFSSCRPSFGLYASVADKSVAVNGGIDTTVKSDLSEEDVRGFFKLWSKLVCSPLFFFESNNI
jgi:hypothetical protein